MLACITTLLAKRRVRRKQQERRHYAKIRRAQTERDKHELELIAQKALLRHMTECCLHDQPFKTAFESEDAHVSLRSAFNPTISARETRITVFHPHTRLQLTAVYSNRAVITHQDCRVV